jgi:hypothetical protein
VIPDNITLIFDQQPVAFVQLKSLPLLLLLLLRCVHMHLLLLVVVSNIWILSLPCTGYCHCDYACDDVGDCCGGAVSKNANCPAMVPNLYKPRLTNCNNPVGVTSLTNGYKPGNAYVTVCFYNVDGCLLHVLQASSCLLSARACMTLPHVCPAYAYGAAVKFPHSTTGCLLELLCVI